MSLGDGVRERPSSPSDDEAAFKTYRRHRRLAGLLPWQRRRPRGFRRHPELIRLDVERDGDGEASDVRPPVRIFVGTEPAQHRAERVLVWSIIKARDPSRVYEIYLMRDLEGFDRRRWKTGFTGYRYAIPALAGGKGRAIYNDVDQVYLADPAELFDLEMGGAGQLSITERETSVMLLDCAKMTRVWDMDDARRMTLHKPFRIKTAAVAGLWRPLPAAWNARDFEYRPGRSKLLHFTILHTQPWQPFPRQLKYRPHALADLWGALERDADAERFTLFTKARPSSRFRDTMPGQMPEKDGAAESGRAALRRHRRAIDRLARETGARSILFCAPGQGRDPELDGLGLGCPEVGSYDPLGAHGLDEDACDGVVSSATLDRCPDDDVPWVLDDMFARARRFVYVMVANDRSGDCCRERSFGEGAAAMQDADWWRTQMACAARRHPGVRWTLCAVRETRLGRRTTVFTGISSES